MIWKCSPLYWPFVRKMVRQKASNVELWYFSLFTKGLFWSSDNMSDDFEQIISLFLKKKATQTFESKYWRKFFQMIRQCLMTEQIIRYLAKSSAMSDGPMTFKNTGFFFVWISCWTNSQVENNLWHHCPDVCRRSSWSTRHSEHLWRQSRFTRNSSRSMKTSRNRLPVMNKTSKCWFEGFQTRKKSTSSVEGIQSGTNLISYLIYCKSFDGSIFFFECLLWVF